MTEKDTLYYLKASDEVYILFINYLIKLMASLFIIEILFNIVEGNGIIELLDFDNICLSLIIFEVFWRINHMEANILFEFIHVVFIFHYFISFFVH